MAIVGNAFKIHTEVVEEFQQKLFYVLGDLNLMVKPDRGKRNPNLPKDILALVEAIGSAKSLSAATRRAIAASIMDSKRAHAELIVASAETKRTVFAGTAIIWASTSWSDLNRGLALIGELFPTKQEVTSGIQSVRDLISSGQGRIYGTSKQPLLDPAYSGSLPGVVYSATSTLKADAAGAFGGAVASPVKTPQVIAGIAIAASLGAATKDVLDWLFPEQVPLFPGGTGPYNPYPSPTPV